MGVGTTEQKGEVQRTLFDCVSRKKGGDELGPHCPQFAVLHCITPFDKIINFTEKQQKFSQAKYLFSGELTFHDAIFRDLNACWAKS